MGIMLLAAYDGLTAAMDPDTILDNPENHPVIQDFAESRDQIAAVIDVDGLRARVADLPGTEVQSPEEASYRHWCLHHRLFLNPLNDLGPLLGFIAAATAGEGLHVAIYEFFDLGQYCRVRPGQFNGEKEDRDPEAKEYAFLYTGVTIQLMASVGARSHAQ
jgi:hypothetical protein